jgi:hypothetical protein
MSTNNSDLRTKIDEAKRLLPLPQLLERLGLGAHAKKSALCPLHDDKHPSFSVFQARAASGITSVLPAAARAMKSCSLEN